MRFRKLDFNGYQPPNNIPATPQLTPSYISRISIRIDEDISTPHSSKKIMLKVGSKKQKNKTQYKEIGSCEYQPIILDPKKQKKSIKEKFRSTILDRVVNNINPEEFSIKRREKILNQEQMRAPCSQLNNYIQKRPSVASKSHSGPWNSENNLLKNRHSHQKHSESNREQRAFSPSISKGEAAPMENHQMSTPINKYRFRSQTLGTDTDAIEKTLKKIQETGMSKTIQFDKLTKNNLAQKQITQIQAETTHNKQLFSTFSKEQNYYGSSPSIIIPQRTPQKDHMYTTTSDMQGQLQNLTQEFLSEWTRMRSTKEKIYDNFRHRMALQFPEMRRHYTQIKIPNQQEQRGQKPNAVEREELFITHLGVSRGQTISLTQIKEVEERHQKEKQSKMLQDVFKRAYFYSRSKGKYIYNSIISDGAFEQSREIKQIQKNVTFQNYIKGRTVKKMLAKNKCKRGFNLIKHKDAILKLEKDGTRQQSVLKRCLEDAIDDCLRYKEK